MIKTITKEVFYYNMKNIVVGAGIGGLSIAALLAKKGQQVTVIEKNSTPGGRARLYSEKGFKFDMGPSWYLMPDIFEDYFKELEIKVTDIYNLVRIDPSYRIFFEDGSKVDVYASLEDNIKLFDELEPEGGEKLKKYLEKAEKHYKIAKEDLLYRDYNRLLNLIDGRLLLNGLRLPIFGDIDSFIQGIFSSDKAKRILEYSIGFVGGSPKNTPSIYYIMNHVDFKLGVWYPIEGIWKVIEQLYEICLKNGVEFKFNEAVEKINVKGVAHSVDTDIQHYISDNIIVTADYAYSELNLLDEENRSYDKSYWDSKLFAPTALVIYIGLNKKLTKLLHHNLYLAGDWNLDFETLYDPDTPSWPNEVSYYVNITSKTDPTVAPKGKETIFILIPLPSGIKDTYENREKWYQQIVSHLEKLADEKIIGYEEVKTIFGPEDFKRDYNAYNGTSLGLVHTLNQSAIFRPSHLSKKVKNLYYTGQYTHPGIGLPLVLISSQILVDRLIKKT
ncbi:phytoene desaturase [Candidatus Bathyarchaeota archaeon]|nr:phytoene desaturase [Candidatus Bathyarchaeota archaeon]